MGCTMSTAIPSVQAAGATAPAATSSNIVGANPSLATGTQNYAGTQSQTGQGASTSANVYSPTQQALQSQTGQSLLNFLSSGTVPGNLTAPPSVLQAYSTDFQNYVEPSIAAQYGAGSPQIGGQEALGLQNLMANLYQTGVNSYLSGENLAGQLGYIPIAATAASGTSGQSNINVNQTQAQSILSYLLNNIPTAASGISNLLNSP